MRRTYDRIWVGAPERIRRFYGNLGALPPVQRKPLGLMDGLDLIPSHIHALYEVHEWRHACAILRSDFTNEWNDMMTVLGEFQLYRSDIVAPGGGKSLISQKLDKRFERLGWHEKGFVTSASIDGEVLETRTHKVDRFKNRIALEVEWNNKDPFFDRDLYNFRHLFDLNVIGVGVIITRTDALQSIFDELGEGKKYGPTTTHMAKLLPRLDRGGGGGCPILVFGITKALYVSTA